MAARCARQHDSSRLVGSFLTYPRWALAQPRVDADDGPFDVFPWTSAVVEALCAALDALNETDPLVIEWN